MRRMRVVTVGSLLGLLASWTLLFVYMLLMTDAELNPWDTAPASALPLAGTLPGALHDLFTTFPTVLLPALVVPGVSVGLFLKQAVSTRKSVPLAVRFAAINSALVGIHMLSTPFVSGLERQLLEAWGVSLDYSYSRHAISIAFWLVLLFVWLWLQRAPTVQRGAGKTEEAV